MSGVVKPLHVVLPDALHARPAGLLVRVASDFESTITIVKGERRANAKSILEVLSLGAAKGDSVDLLFEGDDAAPARQALNDLIDQNFSADLVPETGAASVPGIAIGTAHVIATSELAGEVTDAAARFREVRGELERDLSLLPSHERELLEPELAILHELEPRVIARMGAMDGAQTFREAVDAETGGTMTDLFLDARARLTGERLRIDLDANVQFAILIAPTLPPSLVASLPPQIVGIVSALGEDEEKHGTGNTSHAAIIARSRGIPLAFVGIEVTESISHADTIVLDTTEGTARVWIQPSEKLLADATQRRDAHVAVEAEHEARADQLAADVGVTLRVNVSRIDEELPAHARGVGLVRTELLFAANRMEPSAGEQATAYRSVTSRARGFSVTIRLFDAGGDKPLPWLPSSDPDLRGAALLFEHENVLRAQLQAIADARDAGDARALIPLTRSAEDVRRIRALAPPGLCIGAMIETKEAVDQVDEIAKEADFLSIGTNDLTASVLGVTRADAGHGLKPAVFASIERTIAAAHAHGREISVCGELAAHVEGAGGSSKQACLR